jgi:tetratricopeptide (TPR) repeat protein
VTDILIENDPSKIIGILPDLPAGKIWDLEARSTPRGKTAQGRVRHQGWFHAQNVGSRQACSRNRARLAPAAEQAFTPVGIQASPRSGSGLTSAGVSVQDWTGVRFELSVTSSEKLIIACCSLLIILKKEEMKKRTVLGLIISVMTVAAGFARSGEDGGVNAQGIEQLFSTGQSFEDEKEYDQAIAVYSEIIGLGPDCTEAYYNRGYAYDNKKDYDRAIEDYTAKRYGSTPQL